MRFVTRGALTSVLISTLIAVPACVPPRPLVITAPPAVEAVHPDKRRAPHPAVQFYNTFWDALADVNVQAAWIAAESREQRTLADAIEDFLDGRNHEADSTLTTILGANDSAVRKAARITYGALLTSQGAWRQLANFADSATRETRDAAGVEAWAPAFKNVSTNITFADTAFSLPLTHSVTGVAIIPVTVNGVKLHFWLDTGTSITILSSSVADAANVTGLGKDTLELVGAVGRVSTQAAVVKTVKIGGVTIANAPAMVVSDLALQIREVNTGMPPVPVDGVIGFDVIRELDLTINDIDGVVVIRKPTVRPADDRNPRNLSWFGVPIVTLLSDNGTPIHLLLDTGAEETFGTPGLAAKSHAHWRAAERRTIQGFGGRKIETGVVIPSVRLFLGDVPLVFKRIFLYRVDYPTIFKLDGTLGAEVARGQIMRIDMTNGHLDIYGRPQ
ncbi:MAG: aspartyl protease family protein [Gemmatimonadaceae bacterium]